MKNITEKGITFFPVPEFSDADIAFGADSDKFFNRNDLPEFPSEYEDKANALMFRGGEISNLSEKVSYNDAMRAVRAWLGSFAPAHEAKTATVGYALWVWSKDGVLDL